MLTVATWNIGLARLTLLGIPLVDAVPHAAARMRPIAEALAARRDEVDIWLLQEAYGPPIRRLLRAVPGYHAVLGPGWMRDCGLCILVRDDWETGSSRHRLFPANDWVEVLVAAKGVLTAEIMTPLGLLRLGTLHASYDGRGRRSIREKAPLSRRRQAGIAKDLMEAGDATPLILGGDFNASLAAEPETHRSITGRGWRDLALTANRRTGNGLTTWASGNRLASGDSRDHDIDLLVAKNLPEDWTVAAEVFMHENILSRPDGDALPLSDHHALKVTLSA